MKCIYCMLTLLFSALCNAQLLRSSLPVSYTTVGTYSRHFTDVFSFTRNQAALSGIKNTATGLYSEKRFMLRELKAVSAAVSFPCLSGGAGIAVNYTGFVNYNQTNAGLAYGKSLGANLDLGVQCNYTRISVGGYGSAAAIGFELGMIAHLTDKVHAGCHVYNPFGGKFGKNSDEKLPSVYSFGLGYEASEKLFISAEIIKEENQPVDFNIVLHYAFEKQFFIRGGVSSATGNYFGGAGIFWKNIRLDIAAGWHPKAGLTPLLALVFILSHTKTEQE